MSNDIINQNADEQEVAHAPAATTKSPVDNSMEEQTNDDLKGTGKHVKESEENNQPIANLNSQSGSAVPDLQQGQKAVSTAEVREPETQTNGAVPPSPHDDFDWSVDKRNVTSYNKKKGKSMTKFMIKLSNRLMTMK